MHHEYNLFYNLYSYPLILYF